jgi:type II secretion system protein G
MKKIKGGFTLIELLIIIIIILTLLTLALPPLMSARTRAEIARVQQDLQVLESAIEWYYMDHKRYPESTKSTALTNPQGVKDEGLLRLTRPIRYIDRLPEDRFYDSLLERPTLLYEFGSGGNPTANGKRIEAWMLASKGPDRFTDTRSIDTYPMGTVALEYNPTNGLRSSGDMLRYGGNYGEGNWFLNGKRITQNNQ